MKFNPLATTAGRNKGIEKISKRMAYHQAGYAASIYLGNQQKQLPAIHFQVAIKPQVQACQSNNRLIGIIEGIFSGYVVKVEGGRLFHNLPLAFSELVQHLSWYKQAEYRCALEADVTNLLVGSLAEAKFVALRDGEVFSANLVNLNALHFYSDKSEIELINQYMDCYLHDKSELEQKLAELFLAAFRFVDDINNWRKIAAVAEHILRQTKPGIIHCEEVISILDSGVPLSKIHPLDLQRMEYG